MLWCVRTSPTVTRSVISGSFTRCLSRVSLLGRHTGTRELSGSCGWSGGVHTPRLRPATLQCRSSSSSVLGDSNLFLIIYSKPGCHLCDGLKDKVQAVLDKAMFQPSPLSHASLQIRNILEEPEWESAYGMVIPVMTAIKSGQSEELKIPRSPPRISADRLSDHIIKSLHL